MTTNSWLSPEDIANEAMDSTGRPVSPAPLVDGDVAQADAIHVEFPDGGSQVTMNRRDFVRLGGVAAAAAGLAASTGCQVPTEAIVPYSNRDGSIIPGDANYYATIVGGEPARVKTRAGKPIHIEGNALNGSGGTTALQGAAILDLYDPDRAEGPAAVKNGQATKTDWATLDKAVIDAAKASGTKTRLLTGPVTGHATREAIDEFLAGVAGGGSTQGMHVAWSPQGYDALRKSSETLFGVAGLPDYRLADARVIVSFGADFLGSFISPTRFAADWANGRNVDDRGDKMSSTIVLESRLSVTGAKADRRYRVRQSELVNVAGAIANLIASKRNPGAAISAQLKGFDPTAVAATSGVSVEDMKRIASQLVAHAGQTVVFGGGALGDQALDGMALLINHMLGNLASTVILGGSARGAAGFSALSQLVDEMNKGRVETLIIAGTNPVYVGAGLGVGSALSKVKTVIYVGDRLDETGVKSHWLAPLAHDLEAWGDAGTELGIHSIQQPSIRPMNDSRGLIDHLIAWGNQSDDKGRVVWTMGGRLHTAATQAAKAAAAGDSPSPAYYYLRDSWNARLLRQATDMGLDRAFDTALRTGFFVELGRNTPAPNLASAGLSALPSRPVEASTSWDVLLTPNVAFGAGEGVAANNGWLQELADPITHVVWDSVAQVSPRDAASLDLKDGDRVEVAVGSTKVIVPAIVQPGLAAKTVVLPVGLGRSAVGAVGNGIGVNAYTLMTANGAFAQAGEFSLSSGWSEVARIGGDDTRDGRGIDLRADLLNNTLRPLCPETTLADWSSKAEKAAHGGEHAAHGETGKDHGDDHGGAVKHYNHEYGGATYVPHGPNKTFEGGHPGPSHWSGHEYPGYRWAMTIDTNTCTGCNSCVIACQSENNIAVCGKAGVIANREMNWLRIDRYYAFDRQANDPMGEAQHGDWDHLAPTPEGALDNPKVHFQPMLCQHCENAGCEAVCPFTATMHDDEGVNQQAYNRCVGTRYCANNCAYKVRRYNWFEYSFERTNWIAKMANPEGEKQARYNNAGKLNNRYNPEVTVRTRGVMEKCSFCTQRIQASKQLARSEGRQIRDDGELQTACQAACPTNAIAFGDINNSKTTVARHVAGIRSYRLLEEVGAKPSVFYLTRIWNA